MINETNSAKGKTKLSSHPKGALALVGLWKDIPEAESDKVISEIYQAREKDTGLKVDLGELRE